MQADCILNRIEGAIPWCAVGLLTAVLGVSLATQPLCAQEKGSSVRPSDSNLATTQDRNERLKQMSQSLPERGGKSQSDDYRIGPADLVDITVFEASELNRSLRVSSGGEISMPPLGVVKVAGLTTQELEAVLGELLRRSVLQDPHVSVFVREIESHPVSVTGAVRKPGVFRIRDPKTLLEMLSMAEGLTDDAGDTVLVMRGGSFPVATEALDKTETSLPAAVGRPLGKDHPAQVSSPAPTSPGSDTVDVNLKNLLNSNDPRYNILVYPGDIVKVNRAGIVYVLGEVKKPGGFVLRNNDNITVLQALAMAEGVGPTSAKSQTRIIRTDENSGHRTEIALDLGKVMGGKVSDPLLQPKDIVFVPKSTGKGAFFRSTEIILSTVPGALIYGKW